MGPYIDTEERGIDAVLGDLKPVLLSIGRWKLDCVLVKAALIKIYTIPLCSPRGLGALLRERENNGGEMHTMVNKRSSGSARVY